jgi:hypothetical protein
MLLFIYSKAVNNYKYTKEYPTTITKTLILDPYFSEDEVFYITMAAWEWQRATHNIARFNIVQMPTKEKFTQDSILVIKVSPQFPEIIAMELNSNKYRILGYYSETLLISYIGLVSDRLDNDNYQATVAHELGHALGLEHNTGLEGINTLMFPTQDLSSDYVTRKDVSQFCKLYKCNPLKLQY